MKLIALPDLHGDYRRLSSIGSLLAQVDLVLLAGDLTNFGGEAQAAQVVDTVRQHNLRVLAVPGNCDEAGAQAYLSHENINLQGTHVEIDGVVFAGAGGSLPGPVRTPNEVSEDALRQMLEASVAGLDQARPVVLLCHQPPANTRNDIAFNRQHVGSQAVRVFIEQAQPLACFTGHIHEGTGIDTIGRTRVVNPGPLSKGGYAYAEITGDTIHVECRKI